MCSTRGALRGAGAADGDLGHSPLSLRVLYACSTRALRVLWRCALGACGGMQKMSRGPEGEERGESQELASDGLQPMASAIGWKP